MTDDACKRPHCEAWHGSADRDPARGTNEFDGTDSRETSPAELAPSYVRHTAGGEVAITTRPGDFSAEANVQWFTPEAAAHVAQQIFRPTDGANYPGCKVCERLAANASASPAPTAEGLAGLSQARKIVERNLVLANGREGGYHEGGRSALNAVLRGLDAAIAEYPAGLSQALPTRLAIARILHARIYPSALKNHKFEDLTEGTSEMLLRCADDILVLLRESRESRPPVATSDKGGDSHNTGRHPVLLAEPPAVSSTGAAAPAERVEEPRCAYVSHAFGDVCGAIESAHGLFSHPFTAVPPVAREEKPRVFDNIVDGKGYEHVPECHQRLMRCVCTHGRAPYDDAPRRVAIEQMHAERAKMNGTHADWQMAVMAWIDAATAAMGGER